MSTFKILILGSGMVAPPCLEYLTRNVHNHVTIASRTLEAAERLASLYPRTQALALDVTSQIDLDTQVAIHDLVISLIPYVHHVAVIESAIRGKTNVVTTSYTSDAMKALEPRIKDAGITVLNEVGVDPGIDHMYAVKLIDEVHSKGGKVKEYYSYCGGLPAPEHAENPLRFKFSWSPRGAILSQMNSASFLENDEHVTIPSAELMATAKPYHVMDGYSFVAYPNRNSIPFKEYYKIPEAHTVIRGSLRYEGNPAFIQALASIGWLDQTEKPWLKSAITWAEIQQKIINAKGSDEESLVSRIQEIYDFTDAAERDRIISGMHWLGLFSDELAPVKSGNVFDTLCHHLGNLLAFAPGERDLVMLQHKFVVEWEDGKKDTITSTLELLGDPEKFSAMALSVGLTCGVASQLLLDGSPSFNSPGLLAPYTKSICDPIRNIVAKEGVELIERVL